MLSAIGCLTTPVQTEVTTRAAFDLGSGKFKLLVAEVDSNNKIVREKYSKMIDIKLGEVFQASGEKKLLDEKIQKEALTVLKNLKIEAEGFGAKEFSGISTAVFRKANNGLALLEQLIRETGVSLVCASAEEEGVIGFKTAVALAPEFSEESIVSWDSGNGSFQIAAKENGEYKVYEGTLGNSTVAKKLVEEIRGQKYVDGAMNPISLQECEHLSSLLANEIQIPTWLQKKLEDTQTEVISIGDHDSIFAVAASALQKNHYTFDEVNKSIQELAGSSSEKLEEINHFPEAVLTRLVLLKTVMEKFGISKVTYKPSAGSLLGVVTYQPLWKKA